MKVKVCQLREGMLLRTGSKIKRIGQLDGRYWHTGHYQLELETAAGTLARVTYPASKGLYIVKQKN